MSNFKICGGANDLFRPPLPTPMVVHSVNDGEFIYGWNLPEI